MKRTSANMSFLVLSPIYIRRVFLRGSGFRTIWTNSICACQDKLQQIACNQHKMNRLLVALEAPYTILAVAASEPTLLGYSAHQLVGNTFGILSGPMTDSQSLINAIASAGKYVSTEMCTVVYDRVGCARDATIVCEPYMLGGRSSKCCMLALHLSYFTTLPSAFVPALGYASALTSAEAAHSGEHAQGSSATRRSELVNSATVPRKRGRTTAPPAAAVDVAYVRRIRRKHRDADRRAAAAAGPAKACSVVVAQPRCESSDRSSCSAATTCSLASEAQRADVSERDSDLSHRTDSPDSDCSPDAWGGPWCGPAAAADGWLEQLPGADAGPCDPWLSESDWLV